MKMLLKTALAVATVLIVSQHTYVAGSAEEQNKTAVETNTNENQCIPSVCQQQCNGPSFVPILQGRDGRDGLPGYPGRDGIQGPKGEIGLPGSRGSPASLLHSGVTYNRWGRTTCPSVAGTERLYKGRMGGSYWSHSGGAANYLCMPEEPEYLSYVAGVQGYNYVFGTEYETYGDTPLSSVNQQNAPCAVCEVSGRSRLLMIPAKTSCPPRWTLEYTGYLMSNHHTRPSRHMYECIDKDPEVVPGYAGDQAGAWLLHVEASCNGMPCPPYDPQKELACVVCTK